MASPRGLLREVAETPPRLGVLVVKLPPCPHPSISTVCALTVKTHTCTHLCTGARALTHTHAGDPALQRRLLLGLLESLGDALDVGAVEGRAGRLRGVRSSLAATARLTRARRIPTFSTADIAVSLD
jgi:hypothetical protein